LAAPLVLTVGAVASNMALSDDELDDGLRGGGIQVAVAPWGETEQFLDALQYRKLECG
jgi:hypothetical protein